MTSARISRNVPALTCLTVIPGLSTGGTTVAEGPSPTATDTVVGETAPPPEPEETDLIEGAPTIEGKFSGELSVGLTAKLGNTIAVGTPSKHSTHARYGGYRLKPYGLSVTIYTPRRVGWVLWETT
ncbi:hypothetical protein [Streptomyces sp. CL12-4]|uniref:hypothetical protein n=1 Tax=Streptomyces sp. CL12-4 TaxID=2810306 RepID=UPI001EFC1D4E|nr:hypothetical protein [Streptomyces sp. CL12-4]MCG8971715.1 hypothetical protein [Streptomyces sp. CL12-4]